VAKDQQPTSAKELKTDGATVAIKVISRINVGSSLAIQAGTQE